MGFLDGISGLKILPEGIRFKALMKALDDKEVAVGFNEQSGVEKDGTSTVDVAAWNEYGTKKIPSRPFLRQTVEDQGDKIQRIGAGAVAAALDQGGGSEAVLNQLGVSMKGAIQRQIVKGDFVPNAPSTVAAKGSSKPLIDTGHMRQSIVYVIRKKGEGEED